MCLATRRGRGCAEGPDGLAPGWAGERGGDYFGPLVNTAARVEAAGHGGQVLITDGVRMAAAVTGATDLGLRTLRDVAEPLRLFQLGTDTFAFLDGSTA